MNLHTPPFRTLVLILICFICLTACQPANNSTTQPASNDTTQPQVTMPAPATASSSNSNVINANLLLDPAITQDGDSLRISQYLYEGLTRLDSSGKAQPALAESWVISDDQLDYIFKIRSNATLSDGTPLTPDIVDANFNRWFDPQDPLHGNGNYAAWQQIFLGFHGEKGDDKRAKSTVDGIQKVDFNTVLIHLNRPVPDLLTYLANPAFAILSVDALKAGNYGTKGSTIISSGPYVVSSWTDTGLTLSPNSKYWDTPPSGDLKFTFH